MKARVALKGVRDDLRKIVKDIREQRGNLDDLTAGSSTQPETTPENETEPVNETGAVNDTTAVNQSATA